MPQRTSTCNTVPSFLFTLSLPLPLPSHGMELESHCAGCWRSLSKGSKAKLPAGPPEEAGNTLKGCVDHTRKMRIA